MTEVLIRERNEKFSFAMFLAELAVVATGAKVDAVENILEDYREEVYQLRYNSKYRTARERRFAKQKKKAEEQSRLMARLERITEGDANVL